MNIILIDSLDFKENLHILSYMECTLSKTNGIIFHIIYWFGVMLRYDK